jgi:hypothetical protein
MPKEYSPFTPGLPVPIEFFVGRKLEIDRLRTEVAEAAAGRLRLAFLAGERGIGKSSLAAFVRYLGERDHQMLGLHTFLGGVNTLEEMVRRVFDRLVKESIGKTWQAKIQKFFGNHIREVGLFGVTVEFGVSEKDLARMVNDFVPALRRLVEQLRDEKKGLFLVLDDINGLASSEAFANWLKSTADEIATSREPLPLCMLLVGLDERRQELILRQPSLARVFNVLEIKNWSDQETAEFFANSFGKVGMRVEEEALQLLCQYAGGLPVLAHEIGDATFRTSSEDRIDKNAATRGIIEAADIVGRKHLQPQVFQAIRSKHYRAMLRKLATDRLTVEFKRSDLRSLLSSQEQKVLDNFLRRMERLGVIRRVKEMGPGVYHFTNQLHHLYFRLEALRARG